MDKRWYQTLSDDKVESGNFPSVKRFYGNNMYVNPGSANGNEVNSGLQNRQGVKRRRGEIDGQESGVSVENENSLREENIRLNEEILQVKAATVRTCRLHDKLQASERTLRAENEELKKELEALKKKQPENCNLCEEHTKTIQEQKEQIDLLEGRVQRRVDSINDWKNKSKDQKKEIDKWKRFYDIAYTEAETAKREIENLQQIISDQVGSEFELRDKFQAEITQKNEQIEQQTNANINLQLKEKQRENELRSLRIDLCLLDRLLKDSENVKYEHAKNLEVTNVKIKELEKEIVKKENEIGEVKQQSKNFEEAKLQAKKEIERLKETIVNHESKIRQCESTIFTHSKAKKANDAKIKKLQKEVSKKEEKNEQLQISNAKLQQSEKENAKKIGNLESENTDLNTKLNLKIAAERNQLDEIGELKEQVEIYAPALDENKRLQKTLQETTALLETSEKKLKIAEEELAELNNTQAGEIKKLKAILKKLTSDFKRAEEDRKALNDFAEGVKKAAKWPGTNNYPLVYQLDQLLENVAKKMLLVTEFVVKFAKKPKESCPESETNATVPKDNVSVPIPLAEAVVNKKNQNGPSTSKQAQQDLKNVKKTIMKTKPEKHGENVKKRKSSCDKIRCSTCSKKFSNKSALNMHTKKVHENPSLPAMENVTSEGQSEKNVGNNNSFEYEQSRENSDDQVDTDIVEMDTEDELVDVVGVDNDDTAPELIVLPTAVATPEKTLMSSQSISEKSVALKQHGFGQDNRCLCGVPFGTLEKLQNHVNKHV